MNWKEFLMEISFVFCLLTLTVNYIQDLEVSSALASAQTEFKKIKMNKGKLVFQKTVQSIHHYPFLFNRVLYAVGNYNTTLDHGS